MKKTFLATRNTFLASSKLSWGTGALIVALIVLLLRLFAPNMFWHTFAPVFRVADALTEKSHMFFSSFGNVATLALKNEQLLEANAALVNENQALLKKISELSGLVRDSRGIIAGVVARPPESPYDTLVLAAGHQEGVSLGMRAYGAGGVPLGIVSSVLEHFSQVTLFSAPSKVTDGWVGQMNIALSIFGEGGGAMSAGASRSADILVGDRVFAAGPGMLPIGTVVRVDGDPSSPGIILRIQPALNLFSVAWVELHDPSTALFSSLVNATTTTP